MSECQDCKLWKRQGESQWGTCPIAVSFGSEDTDAVEPACPAFDDGAKDRQIEAERKAVDEMLKEFYEMLFTYTSNALDRAIAAVEAARKGRG
jgi:hypothetical protein